MSDAAPQPEPPADPLARLGALWRSLPGADRTVYATAFLVCVVGLAAQPLWQAADPQLAVSEAYWKDLGGVVPRKAPGARDPWGRRFRGERADPAAGRSLDLVWSVGPNGVDEDGEGDDVIVLPASHPRLLVHRFAGWAAFLLAGAVVGSWELRRLLLRPQRTSLTQEALVAAGVAAPLGMLLMGAVTVVLFLAGATRWGVLSDLLLFNPWVALAATCYLACFLAVLWVRLGRPPEDAPETASDLPATMSGGREGPA